MVSEAVEAVAEELPEYQSSRGREFYGIPTEDRLTLAEAALLARCQAKASNADWSDTAYRKEMRHKKNRYFYHAGRLDIDVEEAERIWWGYVHENPSPHERRTRLI
jgi:hypothetical protein